MLKALEKNPDKRFQTASEMRAGLRKLAASVGRDPLWAIVGKGIGGEVENAHDKRPRPENELATSRQGDSERATGGPIHN